MNNEQTLEQPRNSIPPLLSFPDVSLRKAPNYVSIASFYTAIGHRWIIKSLYLHGKSFIIYARARYILSTTQWSEGNLRYPNSRIVDPSAY